MKRDGKLIDLNDYQYRSREVMWDEEAAIPTRPDRPTQMVGTVILAIVLIAWGVGFYVLGHHRGFNQGVRDHVAAYRYQTEGKR